VAERRSRRGAALYEVARHYGGLVTHAQAETIGIADQRLTELVRRGVIARVARGVYAVAPSGAHDVNPVAITGAHKVALSYESAAAWCGADLPCPPRTVHATASRNRGRRSDSIPGVQPYREKPTS
jgi:predicted transcriptional regulator of viral defense system